VPFGNPEAGVYRNGGLLHHFAILADHSDPDLVFVSFRTDSGPNDGLSGYVLVGDANPPAGSPQFTSVVGGNANDTFPHPDSRDLVFDADGNLLEADDGGLYRLLDPYGTIDNVPRHWESVNGDLRTAETYSVAYDSRFDRLVAGSQDNGTLLQPSLGDNAWRTIHGGDGGVVQVETGFNYSPSFTGAYSVIYHSSQNLGSLTGLVTTYDLFGQPVTFSDPIGLIVQDTDGMTLGELDSPQFIQPWMLNAVNPRRMIFGTQFLYESFDRGDTLTQLGGPPTDLNDDGIDNDRDQQTDKETSLYRTCWAAKSAA
jgi:hypothetical protein